MFIFRPKVLKKVRLYKILGFLSIGKKHNYQHKFQTLFIPNNVGLLNLRQNAEDDYSTLLHLERVLNMRNGGDFVPNLETQIVSPPIITTAFSNKVSGQATLSSSGDHIGLSGGGSHLTKVRT